VSPEWEVSETRKSACPNPIARPVFGCMLSTDSVCARKLAREAGLADEDVRHLFWHLIGLSRRAQIEEM